MIKILRNKESKRVINVYEEGSPEAFHYALDDLSEVVDYSNPNAQIKDVKPQEWLGDYVYSDGEFQYLPTHAKFRITYNPVDIRKQQMLRNVERRVRLARAKVNSGINAVQDLMYQIKYNQAVAFKDTGYDSNKIVSFPYVADYAELYEITDSEAADLIIFKHQEYLDMLRSTEYTRLAFKKRIKEAETDEELDVIERDMQGTFQR